MWWQFDVEKNPLGTRVLNTWVPAFTTCSSSSFVRLLPPWVSRWVLSSSSILLFLWVLLQILQIFFFWFFLFFFYGTWVLETRIPSGKNLHVNNENSSHWSSSFDTEVEPLGLEMLLSYLNCFKALLTNELYMMLEGKYPLLWITNPHAQKQTHKLKC